MFRHFYIYEKKKKKKLMTKIDLLEDIVYANFIMIYISQITQITLKIVFSSAF